MSSGPRRRAVTGAVAGLAVIAFAREVAAHPIDFSAFYAEVEGATVHVAIDLHPTALAEALPALDLDHSGDLSAAEVDAGAATIEAYLEARIRLLADGVACKPVIARPLRVIAATRAKLDWDERCDHAPTGKLTWEVHALLDIQGGHSFFGRTRFGGSFDQFIFKPGAETHDVLASAAPASPAPTPPSGASRAASRPESPPAEAPPPSLFTFVELGVRHILSGWDHLLFVTGLVVAARRLGDLALVISAFTVAHSVTLALGALDLAHVPARLVESMIALSICWVGVENIVLAAPPLRRRVAAAFGFGLLHGLGFSAALRELDLPRAGLVRALLGFNIGVELGQLAVVLPVFALMLWQIRGRAWERRWVQGVSAVVAAAGALWFVQRALGVW